MGLQTTLDDPNSVSSALKTVGLEKKQGAKEILFSICPLHGHSPLQKVPLGMSVSRRKQEGDPGLMH